MTLTVSTTHSKRKDQRDQIVLNTHIAAIYRHVYTCMRRHTNTHKEGGIGKGLSGLEQNARGGGDVWWGCIWTLGSDLGKVTLWR